MPRRPLRADRPEAERFSSGAKEGHALADTGASQKVQPKDLGAGIADSAILAAVQVGGAACLAEGLKIIRGSRGRGPVAATVARARSG
jgi:hypothetical protein